MKRFKRLSKPQAICQIEKHEGGYLIRGFDGQSEVVICDDDEPTSNEACAGMRLFLYRVMDNCWMLNARAEIEIHDKHNTVSSKEGE